MLIWMRLVCAFSCLSIAFHVASSVSTMQSLGLYARPQVMGRAALSSSTIPHGISCSSQPRAWSRARLSPRVTPPRETSPIFTVALPAILQRLTPADARAWASVFCYGRRAHPSLCSSCAAWPAPPCGSDHPGDCVPRPWYGVRARAPRSSPVLSALARPLGPCGVWRSHWCAMAGPVAYGPRQGDAALGQPAASALPSVCGHCKPLAPPDRGSRCGFRPGHARRSGAPTPRQLPPSGGGPHKISTSSPPQTSAVRGQSGWMPRGGDRRFATE